MIMPVQQRQETPPEPPGVFDAAIRSIRAGVVGNPAVALGIAVGVGVLLGVLTKRR